MSCMFYKVEAKTVPSPRFGYKKVDQKEMQKILSRVTQPKSKYGDRPGTGASGSRPKSSRNNLRRSNYATEQEWQRMIRRLQRPTFSQKYARDNTETVRERQLNYSKTVRSKSTKPVSEESLEKLCRPTTASMAKSIVSCHLCGKNMTQTNVFDLDYSNDKRLPQEEVEMITQRMRTNTCSSHPGARPCTRSTAKTPIDSMTQDVRLPLISGLDRSKTVDEIVSRLQPMRSRRNTPAATAITAT